ncbi:MAG: exo-alpha-sialidase [Pirellulales bacterium]|nr:exo-alpha-sialidase [Pirellulales bacterium]
MLVLFAATVVRAERVTVKVVENGESKVTPSRCRGTIVGPGINQPDPFPGYAGFVGWESPIHLANGDWLVGFNAGYWHASVSTPMNYSPANLEAYRKMGMPTNVDAPTGGRVMFTRSTDDGKTWSKPQTLIDTPADDRHPAFVQLADGTIICCFFIYLGDEAPSVEQVRPAPHVFFLRSSDNGHTWDKEPRPLNTPHFHETDGPLVRLNDDSVIVAINGRPSGPPDQVGIFRSADRGESWQLLSTVKTDHDMVEASVTFLADGRWVVIARPEGDISWSTDQGRTWTPPQTFGMRMFAPSLYALKDGTLVCLHGSYAPGHGGLRVIFSTDGGQTWIAPAKDHGFLVDNTYGYGKAMPLADGSLFISYIATGGHGGPDAAKNAIYGIRLRVRPDHTGIDLLPTTNH